MLQNPVIGVTFIGHHGGSDLTETDTVAPTGTPEDDFILTEVYRKR